MKAPTLHYRRMYPLLGALLMLGLCWALTHQARQCHVWPSKHHGISLYRPH